MGRMTDMWYVTLGRVSSLLIFPQEPIKLPFFLIFQFYWILHRFSLYTDVVLFFFSFFSYILSRAPEGLWRENKGSVNRLASVTTSRVPFIIIKNQGSRSPLFVCFFSFSFSKNPNLLPSRARVTCATRSLVSIRHVVHLETSV